jgi:NADH-quinone oxidoreductase subunit K
MDLAIHLNQWLVLSVLLFSIGIYGVLTRRDTVGVLMAVELMLNSAAMNFLVFNRAMSPGQIDGNIMTIFIIAVAAAEAVIALAIFVALFKHSRSIDLSQTNQLKE